MLTDKYTLVRKLAEGGTAEVFEARVAIDPERHPQPCAVKIMHASLARDRGYLETFFREVVFGLQLGAHRNLVTTREFGRTEDGRPWLAADLAGPSLQALWDGPFVDPGRLDAVVAAVAHDVMSGLAHLHAGGVTHCDITPGNVLLGADGAFVLADLGMARRFRACAAHEAEPAAPLPRRDLWKLGVMLWELVAGPLPTGALAGDRPLPALPDAVVSGLRTLVERLAGPGRARVGGASEAPGWAELSAFELLALHRAGDVAPASPAQLLALFGGAFTGAAREMIFPMPRVADEPVRAGAVWPAREEGAYDLDGAYEDDDGADGGILVEDEWDEDEPDAVIAATRAVPVVQPEGDAAAAPGVAARARWPAWRHVAGTACVAVVAASLSGAIIARMWSPSASRVVEAPVAESPVVEQPVSAPRQPHAREEGVRLADRYEVEPRQAVEPRERYQPFARERSEPRTVTRDDSSRGMSQPDDSVYNKVSQETYPYGFSFRRRTENPDGVFVYVGKLVYLASGAARLEFIIHNGSGAMYRIAELALYDRDGARIPAQVEYGVARTAAARQGWLAPDEYVEGTLVVDDAGGLSGQSTTFLIEAAGGGLRIVVSDLRWP